jgi:hypothetical protein
MLMLERGVVRRFVVAAITLFSATAARAHVQPAVDDNNRYLKVTPLGDRVRIAYTVLFGEVPGARERRRIDTDRDGTISEAEARAFADRLGADIADALQLDIDGSATRVRWDEVTLTTGTPTVNAGTFAVDLVTYACLASARGRHRVVLRDRFRIPNPGELEVIVEDSPGVTIERAHVGELDDPHNDILIVGPPAPLADDGLELVFVAGERAAVTGGCASAAEAAAASRTWIYALGAAVVALGAGVVGAIVVRRRRRKMRA